MPLQFSSARAVEETPCSCDPPCACVHREIVGEPQYEIDGHPVSRELFERVVNPYMEVLGVPDRFRDGRWAG